MTIREPERIRSVEPSASVVQALDALQVRLPDMLATAGEDCDFWCEFSGEADAILESAAGDDFEYASGRIDAMLRSFGIEPGYGAEASDF